MARDLKFRIKIDEELHYPCGENKGADQIRGYREADLRLCFRIWKNGFLMTRLICEFLLLLSQFSAIVYSVLWTPTHRHYENTPM